MANLSKYTALYVYVNGRLLTEESEVTITRQSNAQQIRTVAKGFAGVSDGAADMQINFTNAVPSGDFELSAGEMILNNEIVEFAIQGPGGKVLSSKGFITGDTTSHGVGRETTISFTVIAQYSDWK